MKAFFNTQFAEAIPVIYDDEKQDIPEGTEWARFNIRHNDGFQATMGCPDANRFERRGFITVQIFYPQGDNAVSITDTTNTILDIYSGASDSGIYYFDAQVREIGNDGHGWYQVNVLTKFRYDQIT